MSVAATGPLFDIGVSVGLVVATGGQADANTLMKQADEAMYRAKRATYSDTAPEG